ncbi:2Fe-2S iron-sulfur cluster-binding protein [Streptomyces sp. DSS69]|uniref:2Fe-2S iron-sulfur cluster-binding protein n=1 Tax=Streptomyces sp. DSS69 TaxID=3113369 RepID=UPI0031F8F303
MEKTDRPGGAHRLTTVDEVERTIGRPPSVIMLKQIKALDEGCRTVLARSPVAAFGYRAADGTSRTTFIGGAPGFVRVHSPTRISFLLREPADPCGPVSFFFLLPGVGEILRVNGSVAAARKGAEVTVDVVEAFVHCAQAVLRSRLWQPSAPGEVPAPSGGAGAPSPADPADLSGPVGLSGPAGSADSAEPADPAEPAGRPVEAAGPGPGPLGGPGIAEFLAAAPLLALSTWDASGGADTSPRGDRRAAVRILDGRTLLLPDRRGNKRADTLHNLVRDDRLSLAALVPGRTGVLHVRGRGTITDDPALLETMALRGTPPHAALLIDVEYVELTGNDAVARSRLWSPGAHLGRGAVPDLMALAGEHLAANSAEAKGGSSAFLLRALMAVPGLSRLLRLVVDRAYSSGLRKEGYDALVPARSGRRRRLPYRLSAGAGREDCAERQDLREVRIAEVRRETPSAVTLVLEDFGREPGPFDFRPGQFFTLVADIDGRPVRRAYSASSVPGSARLEVTVKHIEGGRFSAHVHQGLRAGDRIAVRGPSGHFHAAPQPPDEIVLVAAGSGVTPIMSMIRTRLSDRSARDRMTLLHSSSSAEEAIFGEELARLAKDHPDRLSVTQVLSRRDGRLDADRVRQWVTAAAPARDAHYYVCGPVPLTALVREVLAGLGVADGQVHHERYTGGTEAGAGTTVPRRMTVERDGQPVGAAVVEPGQTLLEAGLAAGLPMPYSCTVGNCGDCMVRLRDGEVAQSEPNCLTERQQGDGYVLACVGCPLSEVTLDIADP